MRTLRTSALVLLAVGLVASTAACSRVRNRNAEPAPPPENPAATVPPGTAPPALRTAELKPATDAVGEVRTGSISMPDGRNRTYRVYVPTTLPADAPVPVVVGLHGGLGWGEQFEQNSQLDRLAEANGVLMVYPDGIGAGPNADRVGGSAMRTWNGGVCCGAAVRQQVDDVAFMDALLDVIGQDYRVDPDRVFFTGHSNGAIMSYRLACQLSDRIAAIAMYAGTLGVQECAPTSPVSLLHIHGTGDQNIPIGGGVGPNSVAQVAFPPPLDGVRRFAAAVGCEGDGVKWRDATNADLETTLWSPCDRSAEVAFLTIDGASHAWPGSQSTARLDLVGEPYANLDASAEILSFLLAHPKAR